MHFQKARPPSTNTSHIGPSFWECSTPQALPYTNGSKWLISNLQSPHLASHKFLMKNKNPIKDRWSEPLQRRQKRKAKERPKDAQPAGTKKGEKLVPLVVGSYLTHCPSNVINMQIMGSNTNGRSRINITRQCNFPFYSQN